MIPVPDWSWLESTANHLWQSTLVAALAALLILICRKSEARVRYWLAMAASLKFLVPFAALVAIGSWMPWPAAFTMPTPVGGGSGRRRDRRAVFAPRHRAHAVRRGGPRTPELARESAVRCALALGLRLGGRRRVALGPLAAGRRGAAPGADTFVRPRSDGVAEASRASPRLAAAPYPGIGGAARAMRRRPHSAGALVARAAGRLARRPRARSDSHARALPRPEPAQPGLARTHGCRGRVLVPPARLVDWRPPRGGTGTRVRRGRPASRQPSRRLRGRHPQGLQVLHGITAGVSLQHFRVHTQRANRGHHDASHSTEARQARSVSSSSRPASRSLPLRWRLASSAEAQPMRRCRRRSRLSSIPSLRGAQVELRQADTASRGTTPASTVGSGSPRKWRWPRPSFNRRQAGSPVS